MNDRNYGYGDDPGGDGVPGGDGTQGCGSQGGGYGAGGSNGPGGGNKGILFGIAALVVLIALVAAAFMFMGGDDDTENTAEGTGTTATETAATTTDGSDGATTGVDQTTAAEASSSPSAAGDPGDGSLAEPYASAVPAYVRDHVRSCNTGTVTITSYDTNVADRTVSGMRCSGTSGSLIDGNNVEMIDDDEFAKSATDQARTMDCEVIKDEGGVKLIAAAYDGGSSKIFWADENRGISMELYPFDTLGDARAAAEQMK